MVVSDADRSDSHFLVCMFCWRIYRLDVDYRGQVGKVTSTNTTEVSCPETRRVNNRRKNLKKKWTGKIWKDARLKFIKDKGGICEWCDSTEYLTVHHPMRNSYGDETYLNFYLSGCVLLCRKCHAAIHAGKVLCERDHEDGEKHYRWHDAEMCGYCFLKEHPEIKESVKAAKREKARIAREYRKKQSAKAKQWKLDHPRIKTNGNGVKV